MTEEGAVIAGGHRDVVVALNVKHIDSGVADDCSCVEYFGAAIDQDKYLALCWPDSSKILGFKLVHILERGEQVFITYEGLSRQTRFQNTEILTMRDGQIIQAEVHFGWNIPREVLTSESRDTGAE